MPASTSWTAIACVSFRLGTCAAKEAGVALVSWTVLTSPTAFPAALASSRTVARGLRPGSIAIEPFRVFTPVARAVAAAAESVTVPPMDRVRA